ncbi:MAG: response regulator, partial [Armatimonadota bacterium]
MSMSSSGLVVLLVEDNSDDAFLIERQLQRAGVEFELQMVNDGEEAIRYLAGDGDYADRDKFPLPSLILLDLSLPNKSGFDVLGWIREQPSLQNIPVIVLTAADDPKSIQKAFSLGASQYLLKPPSAESLRAIIDDLLWTLSRSLKVLLVDDDPETLPLVKRVLEREFHQIDVTQVVDEIQWQQALDKCEFDVVITDFMLHWSNGIRIARQVKERHPNCPVLMLTASGDEEVAVAGLKTGVDDYIVKNPRHIVRLPVAVRVAMAKIRRQKALSEIERQFQQLFTNLPIGLAIVDAEGRIIHANSALAKMFGFPAPQSMRGLSVFEDFLADQKDCVVVTEQLQKDKVAFHETQWRRKDGSVFWGQISVSTNRDDQGQIIGYQASIIDTTDRRSAEEALRRSEAELKERQKILEKVLKWGQEVARATDLEECLQRIYNFVRHEVGLDRVGIFLCDREREVARRILGTDRDGSVVLKSNAEFDLKGGIFKAAMESPAGFVYTQDYTSEHNLPPDHSMFGVKEHIVAAMWAGEKLVGFLCADNLLSQKPIAETQIETLRLFAGYAAIAIENTKLLEERERRTHLLEKVWEVSREISWVKGLKSCIIQIRNAV